MPGSLLYFSTSLTHLFSSNNFLIYYITHFAFGETEVEWVKTLPEATRPGSGRAEI